MTIRLLLGMESGSTTHSPGAILDLNPALEADLVSTNRATWVTPPALTGDAGKPVQAVTSPGGGIAKRMSISAGHEQLRTDFDRELSRMDYDFRRRGRLGVGEKGALALRFDHHTKAFQDTVKPLLDARALPYQMNCHVTELDGTTPTNPTWATVAAWQQDGMEFFTHGMTHDVYPDTYNGMYDEIVTCKEIAQQNGMDVKGWAMPGLSPTALDKLLVLDDWRGEVGRLLMSHYDLAEAYSGPVTVPITSEPNLYRYGRSHFTIDDQTFATSKELIDICIAEKKSVRVMNHAGLIGTAGKISLADYTAWLDYVVEKRDAGLLDIVLPSSLPYVTNSTHRLDLLFGAGSFAGLSDGNTGLWEKLGGTWNTISPTGGYNNGAKVTILPGKNAPYYTIRDCTRNGFAGEIFQFDGYCKGATDGATDTCEVIINTVGGAWSISKKYAATGFATWRRVLFNFRIPREVNGTEVTNIAVSLTRYGGTSGTEWSNVTIRKL